MRKLDDIRQISVETYYHTTEFELLARLVRLLKAFKHKRLTDQIKFIKNASSLPFRLGYNDRDVSENVERIINRIKERDHISLNSNEEDLQFLIKYQQEFSQNYYPFYDRFGRTTSIWQV